MSDRSNTAESGTAPASFHERSDAWLETALGRDLQGATLRIALYLLALAAVMATIAALAR